MNYQQQSLQGATAVELVIALYDGAVRFLYRAIRAVEEDDVIERRFAVKRTLDILMYLQACLRTDVGGQVAHSLSDFYSAMFQRTLEASHDNSVESFLEVIACLRNVRDAWFVVGRDPQVNQLSSGGATFNRREMLPEQKKLTSSATHSAAIQCLA